MTTSTSADVDAGRGSMSAAPLLLPEPRGAPADAIRTLRPEHIPDIVELRQQVFRFSERGSRQALAEYFQRMFLGDAVRGAPPSLVLEDGQGQVAGFLGVVPRS